MEKHETPLNGRAALCLISDQELGAQNQLTQLPPSSGWQRLEITFSNLLPPAPPLFVYICSLFSPSHGPPRI